jgi:hypothetical protein
VFCLFTLNYIKVLSYSSKVLNYFVINVHIMSRILEIEGNGVHNHYAFLCFLYQEQEPNLKPSRDNSRSNKRGCSKTVKLLSL